MNPVLAIVGRYMLWIGAWTIASQVMERIFQAYDRRQMVKRQNKELDNLERRQNAVESVLKAANN